EDLVERDLPEPEVAEEEPEDEKSGGHAPGDRDLDRPQLLPLERLACDDDRPVPRPHARSVREHGVVALHERVRVQGDRGRLELPLEGPVVQRLDVAQYVLELEAAGVDSVRGKSPEHERVVGVRAVAEPDEHRARLTASRCRQRSWRVPWAAVAGPALTDAIQ